MIIIIMQAAFLDKLYKIYEGIFLWLGFIGFPEPKTLGLLIAILFLLISFLGNLLQRRYARARLHRMLKKDESVLNLLAAIDEYLGNLEFNCNFDVHGTTSPQLVGKAIHAARNKIESTIANIEEHLCSFRHYRKEAKVQGKKRRQPQKIHHRALGQSVLPRGRP